MIVGSRATNPGPAVYDTVPRSAATVHQPNSRTCRGLNIEVPRIDSVAAVARATAVHIPPEDEVDCPTPNVRADGNRIPYPVPFDILERVRPGQTKGWFSTDYLDQDLRISAGNKGSVFVLRRPPGDESAATEPLIQ